MTAEVTAMYWRSKYFKLLEEFKMAPSIKAYDRAQHEIHDLRGTLGKIRHVGEVELRDLVEGLAGTPEDFIEHIELIIKEQLKKDYR